MELDAGKPYSLPLSLSLTLWLSRALSLFFSFSLSHSLSFSPIDAGKDPPTKPNTVVDCQTELCDDFQKSERSLFEE